MHSPVGPWPCVVTTAAVINFCPCPCHSSAACQCLGFPSVPSMLQSKPASLHVLGLVPHVPAPGLPCGALPGSGGLVGLIPWTLFLPCSPRDVSAGGSVTWPNTWLGYARVQRQAPSRGPSMPLVCARVWHPPRVFLLAPRSFEFLCCRLHAVHVPIPCSACCCFSFLFPLIYVLCLPSPPPPHYSLYDACSSC